jgi:predicted ATPase
MDHSLTLSIVLIWSITVFLYTGDLDSAEEHIDWLIARGESHSMAPYVAVGHGFRGALAILRGEADTGVSTLQASLTALHNAPYELLSTPLTISLIEGLAATARNAEGMALTDETIAQVEHNGDDGYLPELLRLRGRLLQSMGRHEEAGDCLTRSLHLSRRQGARAWELRATTDLASLWAGQDRAEDARALLRPLFAQFTEGADTADLKSAERLLASLR